MKRHLFLTCICGAILCLGLSAQAQASFGLERFDVTFTNEDGSADTQAGSHPYKMTTIVQLGESRTAAGQPIPAEGDLKDIDVALPIGMSGDPQAIPHCSDSQFKFDPITEGIDCPNSSAVGVADVETQERSNFDEGTPRPIYNLTPPPGVTAELGFQVLQELVTVELTLSESPPYRVIAKSINVPQPVEFFGSRLEVWGNPEAPTHDLQRGRCAEHGGSCPANAGEVAFLTLPASCNGPLVTEWKADSWEEPGAWTSGRVETHDNSSPPNPLALTGCGLLGTTPTTSALPTTLSAESPSGLAFGLNIADEGLTSPLGISQSPLKKVEVTLPESVSVNPALAEGLGACTEAELAQETISTPPGGGCPERSKIGTVEVETPLLEQTLKGSLYIATPYENPFDSLIALYVVIRNPETGVLLKLPGEVEPNTTTGQLTSVFDNLPQFPFSHFRLNFRQGQRSPLVTPPTCGAYATLAEITPWSNPTAIVRDSSSFEISSGTNGAACPSGAQPFSPALTAGTVSNSAGSYSPLDLRITRNDGEQEITGLATQLPPGFTANLSGVPFCSEAQIAASRGKTGAQEEAEPSCPPATQIGHTQVGVGVGSVLAYTPGKLYMAGPFEGAPFSVVSITSAKVGPFDLGTVVVHLPLEIDPRSAAVRIPSGAADQIPHIVKGIVVHVRDIRVYVDRSNFALNPTSCERMTLSASVIGSGQNFASPLDDISAPLTNPFQAADCANLAFKPSVTVSTAGKASRAKGTSLSFKIAYPRGAMGSEAWFKEAKFTLPRQLPARLTTIQKACVAATFEANPENCPSAAKIGHAVVHTQIVPVPLEGPVYFVSYGGAQFPEAVLALKGYGITVDLHGETFIHNGVTSATFKSTPDVPFESIEVSLPSGPFSEFGANLPHESYDFCGQKLVIPTLFKAQNGLEINRNTPIAISGCAKTLTKAQKLSAALKACHNKKGKKHTACERSARAKYASVKKSTKTKRRGAR